MPIVKSVQVGTIEYAPAIQWSPAGTRQVATLVRIALDSGIEGVSVTWNDSPSASAMALTIEAWFARALLDFDVRTYPTGAEHLLQLAGWHGTSCVAIAAIDNALWDAKTKYEQVPLHLALGTRHVDLPAYAVSRNEFSMTSTSQIIEHIEDAKFKGYRGFKPHLWGEAKRDLRACQEIRKTLGDDYNLMFDPLGRYSINEALDVGLGLQDLGYLWFEDPVAGIDRHAYPWLSSHLHIPLLATDNLQWNINDYTESATRQSPIGLRLDAGRQGVTFCKKVVDLAARYGVRCEFHAFGAEANSIAGLHVALAQKAVSFYEVCFPSIDYQIPGIFVPTQINADGRVTAPTELGLGLTIDWDYLRTKINWVDKNLGDSGLFH